MPDDAEKSGNWLTNQTRFYKLWNSPQREKNIFFKYHGLKWYIMFSSNYDKIICLGSRVDNIRICWLGSTGYFIIVIDPKSEG